MTEPIRSAGSAPPPNVIELEPILISARPAESENVPIPVGKIALECAREVGGVALAVIATPANPLVAALAGFKAGLDLGECLAETIDRDRQEVSVRRALERCAAAGGTPIRHADGVLECGVQAEVF